LQSLPLDSPSFKDRSILRSFDVAFLVAVLGEVPDPNLPDQIGA